jgi:hypothetical protein
VFVVLCWLLLLRRAAAFTLLRSGGEMGGPQAQEKGESSLILWNIILLGQTSLLSTYITEIYEKQQNLIFEV